MILPKLKKLGGQSFFLKSLLPAPVFNNATEMFDKERKSKRELEKWVLIEESILKQKFKIQ